MKKEEFVGRIVNGCIEVRAAEPMLTEIDSKFGDADHGYTMSKIATVIEKAVTSSDGSIKDMLDDAAMAVMGENGGSAVPLWNTWLDGMQEGAPDEDEMDEQQIKDMFARALEELDDMSGAKVGDKSMMDAFIPATEAIVACDGDVDAIFEAGAAAAAAGAENTKNFKSKFGRAKSYGDKTIGTPDCGALSASCFFKGMAKK